MKTAKNTVIAPRIPIFETGSDSIELICPFERSIVLNMIKQIVTKSVIQFQLSEKEILENVINSFQDILQDSVFDGIHVAVEQSALLNKVLTDISNKQYKTLCKEGFIPMMVGGDVLDELEHLEEIEAPEEYELIFLDSNEKVVARVPQAACSW